jgi:hypothetical protein
MINSIQPHQDTTKQNNPLTAREMAFVTGMAKSYLYANIDPPRSEVLFGLGVEMATETPVKDEHIPRLFIIARRDFRPIPTLSDLKKALATLKGDLEEEERRKRPWIKDQTQPISNEEREIIMQDMWAAAAKVGIYRPSDNVARKK